MSLFERSKFLHKKVSSNDETLQIHKYWYRHDCVLEKTSMHRRFLYRFQLHFSNFAHNVGQRIVLNHAIVYNETLRGGIHGYILLTIEFYAHVHSCALDRFVLSKAIDNHERTILSKIRDSLIRFEIIVSIIVFIETCVRVVENRPSVLIEIQIYIIVRITFRVQIELHVV